MQLPWSSTKPFGDLPFGSTTVPTSFNSYVKLIIKSNVFPFTAISLNC